VACYPYRHHFEEKAISSELKGAINQRRDQKVGVEKEKGGRDLKSKD
jgi:hypothetical protein